MNIAAYILAVICTIVLYLLAREFTEPAAWSPISALIVTGGLYLVFDKALNR